MRCISPLLIRTSSSREFVPCGKCNFCLQTKRADWSFRLNQEHKMANTSVFITLTYEDAQTPISESGLLQLCKRDVQLFTKRLRKENEKRVDWPLRYYTVGEYGTQTIRPHYHSIMFNLDNNLLPRLQEIWSKGLIHCGDVQQASIHYVTKYVINRVGEYRGREPPFALMSKRPGIGQNYLETHKQWHREDMRNYAQVNGQKIRLPRYYKEKIFSEMERKRLSQQSIIDADQAYMDTVDRLHLFHSDPYHYYDERNNHAHAMVTSKINQTNKI